MRCRVGALLAVLLVGGLVATAQAFVHPGVLNNQAEVDFWVSKVAAGQQPWLNAYNGLGNWSTYSPQSTGSIDFGGGGPDAVEGLAFREDCLAAYASTLQWLRTGTQARADKAIEILNWLAAHVTGSSGAFATEGWPQYGDNCVYAAELLKYATPDSGWSSADENAFGTWLKTVVEPRTADTDITGSSGNIGRESRAPMGAALRMGIGIFTNTQALFDQGVTDLKALIRFEIGCQFDQKNWCDAPENLPSGFSFQVCRLGNSQSADESLAGGDLVHTQTALGGMTTGAEIAKHQGVDLYAYKHTTTPPAPADSMGLQDALLYIDQWMGFNQGRSGSSSAGWPCGTALAATGTGVQAFWIVAANQYGNSGQIDDVAAYFIQGATSTEALTHSYSQGGGPVADTTPPTQPTLALASKTHTSISLSASGSTDNIGVTSHRWMHTSGACGNPTAANLLQTTPGASVTHSGLAASSVHCYRVDTRDAQGNDSPDSATLQVTTNAATDPPAVATLYVAPTGNDNNNGSISAPLLTPGKACTIAKPGTTIYLRGGLYTSTGGNIQCKGTANAWITMRNYPGEDVELTGTGKFRFADDGEHYVSAFFKLIGEYVPATNHRRIFLNGVGLSQGSSGDDAHIENVKLRQYGQSDRIGGGNRLRLINLEVFGMPGAMYHCLYNHTSDSIIDGGSFHDCEGYGIHLYNGLAQRELMISQGRKPCEVENMRDTQPEPLGCGLVNNIIRNVTFYNNGLGGLVIWPGKDNLIYNNVFYDNGTAFDLKSQNAQVYNNTFYRNTSGVILRSPAVNAILRNNLFWQPGGSTAHQIWNLNNPAGWVQDHNIIEGSATPNPPLLVNANAQNFHLAAGSPAINAGVALPPLFAQDKDGATRPVPAGGAWDIGAYEFGGTAPSCTKPGNDCTAPSVPPAPGIVRDSNTQVTLNWPDSTGSPTDYHVRQCEVVSPQTTCAPSTIIASPLLSAQTVTNLTPDKTYFWNVSALDANANESESGPAVQMTMTAPVADTTAPSVPTAVACSAPSATQVICTWPASVDNLAAPASRATRCRPARAWRVPPPTRSKPRRVRVIPNPTSVPVPSMASGWRPSMPPAPPMCRPIVRRRPRPPRPRPRPWPRASTPSTTIARTAAPATCPARRPASPLPPPPPG